MKGAFCSQCFMCLNILKNVLHFILFVIVYPTKISEDHSSSFRIKKQKSFNLQNSYHGRQWSGDVRSLGIYGHGWHLQSFPHGPLARYVKLRVAHAPGMPGTFSPPSGVSDPDIHHGTCVTHVPWCMPWSLPNGFFWSRWRGKRSRHSRCMRNPQFTYLISGP